MSSPTNVLTDPWEMHRQLRSMFVGLTEKYLNSHPGRVTNPQQFGNDSQRWIDLRDSVLYRFESLAYHIDLVRQREQQCLSEFRPDLFRRDGIEVVRWASRDMKFLLDDIVFSAISLFDYFGNLIGFVLLRKASENIKWTGVRTWAATGDSSRTAVRALEVNNEWIGGLAVYRNSLIHALSDTSGGSTHHELANGSATLEIRITAPDRFTNAIDHLRQTLPKEGLRVVDAALWVSGQTYDSLVDLCECLRSDLGLPAG